MTLKVSWEKRPELVDQLRNLAMQGKSSGAIATEMRMTIGQIIGAAHRYDIKFITPEGIAKRRTKQKETPTKKELLSRGLSQEQMMADRRQFVDPKPRITLKHIPSIEAWEEQTAYSYRPRDQLFGK